jgi:hypothetical protein
MTDFCIALCLGVLHGLVVVVIIVAMVLLSVVIYDKVTGKVFRK